MAWCYELRGTENRLVELRTGFATENEARNAGRRAKRMIDCICYPNFEPLALVTKEDGASLNHLAEMPPGVDRFLDPQRLTSGEAQRHLKYPWQQLVVDAFMEPHPENLPGKINLAERAISMRLLDRSPFELEERLALGEALLALHHLLCGLAEQNRELEPDDQEDIA